MRCRTDQSLSPRDALNRLKLSALSMGYARCGALHCERLRGGQRKSDLEGTRRFVFRVRGRMVSSHEATYWIGVAQQGMP